MFRPQNEMALVQQRLLEICSEIPRLRDFALQVPDLVEIISSDQFAARYYPDFLAWQLLLSLREPSGQPENDAYDRACALFFGFVRQSSLLLIQNHRREGLVAAACGRQLGGGQVAEPAAGA